MCIRDRQELFGEKVEVTSSDALYQQMKAPLEQIIRITYNLLRNNGTFSDPRNNHTPLTFIY